MILCLPLRWPNELEVSDFAVKRGIPASANKKSDDGCTNKYYPSSDFFAERCI